MSGNSDKQSSFEQKLKTTDQLLQTILSEAPMIIFSADKNGVFSFSSGKVLERLGLLPGQVVGLKIRDVYKDFPDIIEQSDRALKGEEVRSVVMVEGVYFETLYRPIFDEKGEVESIVGIAFDVTDQKKAEKERDIFFDTTLSMICTANMQGYFTRLNAAWGKILGYTDEELLSHPFLYFVHPDDVDATLEEMKKLSQGLSTINFTNRYRCKDDSYKWINWISVPYENQIYATAQDVTENKENEIKQQELLKELERSNNDLEQFAYAASHDLQEPLRKIKNYSDLLSQKYFGQLDDDAQKYIEIITRASGRMQGLIDDLLTFSRISSRGKEIRAISVKAILNDVMDNLEYAIMKNKATVSLPDNFPIIQADKSQICQVLQNLISNSIKYKADADPVIKISITELENEWMFEIKDNGIGIDMDYAEKIFVVFQRLHSQFEYGGTGIGLALCKKIIERHNGKIWLKSEIGKGSSFFFTLPK